jgi:hypothetical protein
MNPVMRSALRFLAALVAGVVLTGCQARVGTLVEASSSGAKVRVEVRFDGDGLQIEEPQQQRLLAVLEERSGERADRSDDGKRFWVEVPIERVGEYANLTGVRSIETEYADGVRTVRAALVAPSALVSAIADGVKGEQDADALLTAALGSTEVGVSVRMGSIERAAFTDSQGGVQELSTGGSEVEWYYALAETRLGVLEVSGRDATDGGVNVPLLAIAAVLLGAIVLAVLRRR